MPSSKNLTPNEAALETLALLKLLELGSREIEQGDVAPIEDVVDRIRARRRTST